MLPPLRPAVATLAIPTAIFDQDIRPKAGGPPMQGVSVRGRADVAKATYDGSLPITVNQCLCHSMTHGASTPAISEAAEGGSTTSLAEAV